MEKWTNDITNPSLEQEVELKWNNEVNAWMVQDQLIEFNKEIEIGKTRDVSLKIFISIVGTTKVFDIGTKHSLTVSQNDYDDISITGTSVDLMLSRETLYDSFKVNVYGGDVFHNYTKLKDSVMLESGDVLYFDGILLEIGSEDIQVLSSEDKVKSELPILVESETNYQSGYPDYHRSPRIIYRERRENDNCKAFKYAIKTNGAFSKNHCTFTCHDCRNCITCYFHEIWNVYYRIDCDDISNNHCFCNIVY